MHNILGEVKNQPKLFIGDIPNYEEKRVAINFFNRKIRIRFEISQEEVKCVYLQISLELLILATIVEKERLK